MDRVSRSRSVPSSRLGVPGQRYWQNVWSGPQRSSAIDGFLAMDVYETDNGFVIEAVLPGAAEDDLKITLDGDTLALEGEVHPSEQEGTYIHRERTYGKFRRTIQLPEVDRDSIDATLTNGILTVTLAKPREKRPRTVPIKLKA